MGDLFGYSTGVDWSMYDSTDYAPVGTPNSGSTAANAPSVDTGGASWATWFDKVVGASLAYRSANVRDATITAYPGAGYGVGYAGQPAVNAQSMMPVLVLGGLAVAVFFLMKS